ncbi:MAG: pyridoxal-phosphate dependent enzyme [Vicingaceae bacterium]
MANPHYSISKDEIDASHQRIKQFIHRTPILTSSLINKLANCQIYFKCENFQKIGAFKMRGASNAVAQLSAKQKENGVVTHSSGNHAQALAKAAAEQNIAAFIVMPRNAPTVKVNAVKEYGGIITFCEPTLQAREEGVRQIIKNKGASFVHPYDNEHVIAGQATAAKELIEDQANLQTIICPVGGGGLLAGTILSSSYYGKNLTVYAGEPKGADDAYKSLKEGRIVPSKNPTTIADGLLTSLGIKNFEIIRSGVKEILLVDDQEIISAMQLIWERLKIIVEPSCAVPLAAILKYKPTFKNQHVGLILSGGNVDLSTYFESLNPA